MKRTFTFIKIKKIILILLSATVIFPNSEPIELKKPKVSLVQKIKRKIKGSGFSEELTTNHQIDGIVGSVPQELITIINQLKNKTCNLNRLLLHGPPGNGKSTIAKKIAKIIDANFIYQAAPAIVKKYIGSAVESIEDTFSDAENLIFKDRKPVVIFIDEIDAIANDYKSKSEFRSEHENALKQLWLCMDKYKDNPNIFIVCATNYFKQINKTFLDRFGSNTIEIKNPNKENRKIIFQHYFAQHNITLDKEFLKHLVNSSKGLSIRGIEDTIKAAVQNIETLTSERVEMLLKKTKSKMNKDVNHSEIAEIASRINHMLQVPIYSYQLLGIITFVVGYLKIKKGSLSAGI